MKIEIEEEDLIRLLKCADDSITLDRCERGNYIRALETEIHIEKMICKINKIAGYKKWGYNEAGIRCYKNEELNNEK